MQIGVSMPINEIAESYVPVPTTPAADVVDSDVEQDSDDDMRSVRMCKMQYVSDASSMCSSLSPLSSDHRTVPVGTVIHLLCDKS